MPDLYTAPKQPDLKKDSKVVKEVVVEEKHDSTEASGASAGRKKVSSSSIRDFIPRKAGTALSSLIILPSRKVRFETQDSEEEVLVIVRAHWLTNVPWIFTAIIMFLAPRVLAYFPLLEAFPPRYQTAFMVGWYLITIMYVFEQFLSWFFNLAIITDERIIDVNFEGLTGRKIADAELDKIQDVTFVNSGVFGTVFNYGDVLVQTAAEVVQFVFNDVPKPAKVAEILQNLRIEEKQEALEGRLR